MATPTPHDIAWFASPAELRAWLAANHETAAELWVGMRPRASGLPTVTWEQVVDEVLCAGWIDGIRYSTEGGSCIRITPRRSGSIWSARNVARVEAMRAEGRMLPAGEAAFARRREDRTAVYSFESEGELDAAAVEALRSAGGLAFFEAQSRTYRRAATNWVMQAKRPETRAKRLGALVEASAAGERVAEISPPARRNAKGAA
jgi:uncharacterized protein YdeI (YjbR/CyaY-like superfamily)